MLEQLLDKKLLEEQAQKQTRIRSGKFSPSSFGRCYRLQYWNRKNEPITNPPSIESLRRFKVGNIFHDFIQQFFADAQTEVKVEEDDILGFLDIELEDRIVDIKSARSYKFKVMRDKGYSVLQDDMPYALQLGYYMMRRNKSIGELVFVDKDALDIIEVRIDLDKIKPHLVEEIAMLRSYWAAGKLPPPLPRAYNAQDCKYCQFKDKCYQLEGREICPTKEPKKKSVRSKAKGQI